MITPKDALAAARAYISAKRGTVVSAGEISRREAICFTCPKREINSGSLTAMSKLLGTLANRKRVPERIKNYRCGVCKCSLMLLLPATDENQHKDTEQEKNERPNQCWIKSNTSK